MTAAPGTEPVARRPSDSWLLELAAHASTLDERIAGQVELTPADDETTARRLAAWSDAVARGEPDEFEVRLGLDGLDRRAAALVVGHATPLPDARVPGWARLVADAIVESAQLSSLTDDPALRDDDPVPAQELALPFLRAARAARDRRCAPSPQLADAAVRDEERHLLRRIGAVWEVLWDRELAVMRDQRFGRLREHLLRAEGWTGREHHDGCARALLATLPEQFERLPALARQLGVICAHWVSATTEFRERLASDRAVIVDRLSSGVDPGPVVEAGWGSSDPHRGGRTVVTLRFASGLGVVYKPKGLASEEALANLVQWLNAQGFEPALAVLRVVDRSRHGWVERVEQRPVPDVAAAERYYERAGGLLALMRALDGSDCHYENVVAAGEHPVLVDGETVLQPRLHVPGMTEDDGQGALERARRAVGEGVLGVGLLPLWLVRPASEHAVDVSGLGGVGGEPIVPTTGWEGLGTDLARRVSPRIEAFATEHELLLDGTVVRREDHESALVRGYDLAHRLIVAAREDFLGDDGLLARMRTAPVRVIVRGTAFYHAMLREARTPEQLGIGVDRSMAFERLFRPLLGDPEPTAMWPALRQERRDLELGDVPFFETRADADQFPTSGGAVRLGSSAIDNAALQLRALDERDLTRQTAFIRASLALRRDEGDAPAPHHREVAPADPVVGARHAGELLRRTAIHGTDADVTWIGAFINTASDHFEVRPAGLDLYDGLSGIVVFLSALARLDGASWDSLSRAAVRTVLAQLDRNPRALDLGGGAGAGGLVAALTLSATWLDDPAVLDRALAVARTVRSHDVEADSHLDLMGGCAGLTLGMLLLHEQTHDPAVLERARWGGDRLLDRLEPAPTGGAAWRTLPDVPLPAGMAHGAAGGALALARLAAATGEGRYADAAREALRFERGHRVAHGWSDVRTADRDPAGSFWCWGSAGIGLARLGILSSGVLPDLATELEDDITHAVADATSAWPQHDHLCCGAAGVAEFARALGDRCPPDLRRSSVDWAGRVAGRLVAGESLALMGPRIGGLAYPGLYHGVAGVGYALLGFVDPRLPVPLAWS